MAQRSWPVGGIEHQVVIERGKLLVDAADDGADIARIEVRDDQTDNFGSPAGEPSRLAVDDIAGPGDSLHHPGARFLADIPLAVDDARNRSVGDLRFARDVHYRCPLVHAK
jgi:hypothetical protein